VAKENFNFNSGSPADLYCKIWQKEPDPRRLAILPSKWCMGGHQTELEGKWRQKCFEAIVTTQKRTLTLGVEYSQLSQQHFWWTAILI
jgi:hypothetical protein